MASYEKVRGSKLVFKGGLGVDKKISKKSKKKKKEPKPSDLAGEGEDGNDVVGDTAVDPEKSKEDPGYEIDTGTGHAPDGKKSKKYEELFPVETKRHGYVVPTEESREAALHERVKKKADRYCK